MNEPTSTSFKDFIELYRRTEEANAPNSDSIWLQLEELARKALSTANPNARMLFESLLIAWIAPHSRIGGT